MAGLSAGTVLVGRYRLGQRIAVGGMGEVWGADDTRLGRRVAVKVLKPELSADAEFRRRFSAEARMTASLNHPGIAAVHDYGETAGETAGEPDSWAYIVMELVTGEPLSTILARQTRLSTEKTLDILEQAGNALQAAHERGLVHRDVKPANILITPTGTVKLTDFGIARAIDAAPMTRHGMVMGTAHYIAPEQAAGSEAGPAGDVYSLAVVGYECLAGRRPFPGDNAVSVAMMHIRDQPPPLPADVPSGARALIETGLVKDPRERYRTGGEFAAATAAARAGHRPAAGSAGGPAAPTALLPGPPHTQRAPRLPARRRSGRIALVLLGGLTLLLGGYLARDALSSPVTPSGAATGNPPAGTTGAPTPVFDPFAPDPTKAQAAPQGDNRAGTVTSDAGPEVLIIQTDYWGHRGSDAAVAAKRRGLIPLVVDDNGEPVDPDQRSRCRIIGVDPLSGFVPRGSTIELTCRRGK